MKKSLLLLSGLGLGAGLAYTWHQDRQAYRRAMDRMTHYSRPRRLARWLGSARRSIQQQTREFLPQPWQRHTSYTLPRMPHIRRSTIVTSLVIIGSFGLGAGLMYVLDVDRGRRRRARFKQASAASWRRLATTLRKTSRDLGNRTRGVLSAARQQRRSSETPDDALLIARVRSQIGHVISHPNVIDVNAQQGRVTLSGPVPADEVDKLLKTVRGVLGVHEVVNQLESHAHPNDM